MCFCTLILLLFFSFFWKKRVIPCWASRHNFAHLCGSKYFYWLIDWFIFVWKWLECNKHVDVR
jgi:hypothetical protein